MTDSVQETGKISLRPAQASDAALLFRLYASTRAEEMALFQWDEAQAQAFLQMQFNMQKRSYEMQFPAAQHSIILMDGQEVGRLMVDRAPSELLLVDIALLPEVRGHGIGGKLIRELQEEAAREGKAVRLTVVRNNPALRLYERLGFVTVGDDGIYLEMLWRAEA